MEDGLRYFVLAANGRFVGTFDTREDADFEARHQAHETGRGLALLDTSSYAGAVRGDEMPYHCQGYHRAEGPCGTYIRKDKRAFV